MNSQDGPVLPNTNMNVTCFKRKDIKHKFLNVSSLMRLVNYPFVTLRNKELWEGRDKTDD